MFYEACWSTGSYKIVGGRALSHSITQWAASIPKYTTDMRPTAGLHLYTWEENVEVQGCKYVKAT